MTQQTARAPAQQQPLILLTWCGLLAIVCLFCSRVSAQSPQSSGSAYDGLQLGPTVHVAYASPHIRGGFGADLSLHRWLDLEVWGSRLSRPSGRHYPGAWSAGFAMQSRIAWTTHAFVYGAGLVYTTRFVCEQGCALFPAIVLDEPRAVTDMLAGQVRLGYEARAQNGLFVRALGTFDVPFARRYVEYSGPPSERYRTKNTASTFMHGSLVLTLGYAFRIQT